MSHIERIKFNKDARKLLVEVFAKLNSKDEIEEVFKDLLSSKEILELSRRLLAVKMLYHKKTYLEISQTSGMGQTTINRMHFKTKGSKILRKLLS